MTGSLVAGRSSTPHGFGPLSLIRLVFSAINTTNKLGLVLMPPEQALPEDAA